VHVYIIYMEYSDESFIIMNAWEGKCLVVISASIAFMGVQYVNLFFKLSLNLFLFIISILFLYYEAGIIIQLQEFRCSVFFFSR
jgi:hypothetical protein